MKDGISPSSEKGVLSKVQDYKIRYYFEKISQDSFYDFLKTGAHDSALIKASCKPASSKILSYIYWSTMFIFTFQLEKWIEFSDRVKPILLTSDATSLKDASKLLITGWGLYKAIDEISELGGGKKRITVLEQGK